MTVFLGMLLFVHLMSWAIVLGAAVFGLKSGALFRGTFHAVLTALASGVAMVLVAALWAHPAWSQTATYSHWATVKLILGVALTGVVWFASRKPDKVSKSLLGVIAVLTTVTVAVATIWR